MHDYHYAKEGRGTRISSRLYKGFPDIIEKCFAVGDFFFLGGKNLVAVRLKRTEFSVCASVTGVVRTAAGE